MPLLWIESTTPPYRLCRSPEASLAGAAAPVKAESGALRHSGFSRNTQKRESR
jgi:hypothetical protein